MPVGGWTLGRAPHARMPCRQLRTPSAWPPARPARLPAQHAALASRGQSEAYPARSRPERKRSRPRREGRGGAAHAPRPDVTRRVAAARALLASPPLAAAPGGRACAHLRSEPPGAAAGAAAAGGPRGEGPSQGSPSEEWTLSRASDDSGNSALELDVVSVGGSGRGAWPAGVALASARSGSASEDRACGAAGAAAAGGGIRASAGGWGPGPFGAGALPEGPAAARAAYGGPGSGDAHAGGQAGAPGAGRTLLGRRAAGPLHALDAERETLDWGAGVGGSLQLDFGRVPRGKRARREPPPPADVAVRAAGRHARPPWRRGQVPGCQLRVSQISGVLRAC